MTPPPPRRRSESDEEELVTEWHGFTLSSFQIKAVGAVRAGRNVLVAAPTGAGKTLVAEYAIEDAVRRGKRCIYTSPIKALSNQKYRDFRDAPDIDVGIMTGDVTLHGDAQVLIMTTEILRNALFESPELLEGVEYVIFDEVHYMDDRERGTVWEESLIFLPPSVRLICLSATISNIDELGSWLAEIRPQEMAIVRSDKRPVPLSHHGYAAHSKTFDISKIERIAKLEAGFSGGRGSRRREGRRGGRGRGRGGNRYGPEPVDPRPLFDMLESEKMLPALVFSFSRKDCERLAHQNERRELLNDEERARMDVLQRELIELFQLDEGELRGEIFRMTRHGVGYHHAGMLPVHKEVVERMFTGGLLKLLFTTETFALGINMPARSAVFVALRKFDGVAFDWLRVRDYMQMAGRAGRQGIDDKGHVFSILDERALREAPMKKLIGGRAEPVVSRFRLAYSTLLHLVDRLGRDRVYEAYDKSFHQFQGRAKNTRAREKQQREQRRLVEAHLAMLEELGYLDGDQLTARGRIARLVNGYDLQVTELLFQGTLENLPPRALACIFAGLIHEERRRDRPFISAKLYGDVRNQADLIVGRLCGVEARFGIPPSIKRPDWAILPAVLTWYDGGSMDDIENSTETLPGDACRVFRMMIQLMRNVRRAIDPEWDLGAKLIDAAMAMNRDEVDARRQLELG